MRKIGALVFPGFELLDLFGPLEMFGILDQDFEVELVAEVVGKTPSAQSVSVWADKSIHEAGRYDLLLVPGGPGTRREVSNPAILNWIAESSTKADLTMSVCTGSALLARSGVLDGHHATTNKEAFSWVTDQGPKVKWVHKARWVEDGRFITSSGVSAGIDMSLGVIASALGEHTAAKVANSAEYIWNRDRDNDPFASSYR